MVIYCRHKWFFCVAFGAFSAHGLAKTLEPKSLAWIETGLKYQIFHTVALMGLSILQLCNKRFSANKWLNCTALSWVIGILLFSGSLYLFALGVSLSLVWITPIGGTSFLIGWALLSYSCLKKI